MATAAAITVRTRRRPRTAPASSARREVEVANEVNLRIEMDAGPGLNQILHLRDELDDVGCLRSLGGDDEVRVLGRDHCSAHRQALAACFLDQPGSVISGRVLEDAPAVRLGQRLRAPPPLPRFLINRRISEVSAGARRTVPPTTTASAGSSLFR